MDKGIIDLCRDFLSICGNLAELVGLYLLLRTLKLQKNRSDYR